MKILSWDIGIINLSYCIINYNEETKEKNILNWGIINLIENPEMKKNMILVFENIPKKLNENNFLLDVDGVVIENQPSLKNPKMKSIQMVVYSYFLMYGKVLNTNENKINFIDFCNASNKLKVYKGPSIDLKQLKINNSKAKAKAKSKKSEKNAFITDFMDNGVNENDETNKVNDETNKVNDETNKVNDETNKVNDETNKVNDENNETNETNETNEVNDEINKKNKKAEKLSYGDKKKMAVEHVKYFLKENNDVNNLEFFNLHKKKDDLADSYLQGLYMIEQKYKK